MIDEENKKIILTVDEAFVIFILTAMIGCLMTCLILFLTTGKI